MPRFLSSPRLAAAGVLVSVLLLATACSAPPETHTLQGHTMGTQWSVRFVPAADARIAGLRDDIEEALDLVDRQMSTWRDDSDLTRFNQLPAGESLIVPPEFATVLSASLELAEQTDGRFDPTVGPLVNLWGFGPEGRRDEPPSDQQIETALARVGWHRIQFELATRQLFQPGGAYLDFSAIAKGYAADLVAERLEARGITDYIVDLGGDMRIRGHRPDGQRWRIGIERPATDVRDIHAIIEPGDVAVATSGSYRNFFLYGEQAFSHTIDPTTGHPVPHKVVSVTVVHDRCKMADGLATALTVLGAEDGPAFAREHDIAALILIRDNGGVREVITGSFARYLEGDST